MSVSDLMQLEPGLAGHFQAQLSGATAGASRACVDAFRGRRARRDAGATRIEHTLVLSISARGGKAVVRDVKGDAGWPATIDPALQDCLVTAFGAAELEADRDYDYRFEWPIVIR